MDVELVEIGDEGHYVVGKVKACIQELREDLSECVDRLDENTETMHKAGLLIIKLETALKKIAGKRLSSEHDEEGIDYEAGYNILIRIARAALGERK